MTTQVRVPAVGSKAESHRRFGRRKTCNLPHGPGVVDCGKVVHMGRDADVTAIGRDTHAAKLIHRAGRALGLRKYGRYKRARLVSSRLLKVLIESGPTGVLLSHSTKERSSC